MKIKFCGFTNLVDTQNAVEAGVDYLGFVIDFPKSPRSITMENFFKILKKIKKNNSKIVAVVVDLDEEKINKIVSSKLVDIIQFHGDEDLEVCKKFKRKIEIWKAFKPEKDPADFCKILKSYKGFIDYFLIDASSVADIEKGKKKRFAQFDLFNQLQKEKYPLILAGGINPSNVQEFIKKLNPEIIDVASGVEEIPGKKDTEKMKLIMQHKTK